MQSTQPPLRILVVDDDPEDAAYLANLLGAVASLHLAVRTTHDPMIALRTLRAAECDICLVDQRMPGLAGLELVAEARSKGCTQPILLVTGSEEADLDVAAIRAGGSDFLPKDDLDTGRLETALRLALARSGRMPDEPAPPAAGS